MQAQVNAINRTHTSNYVSLEGRVSNLITWQNSAKVQLGKINGITNELNSLKRWKNTHDSWAGNQAKRIATLEGWRTTHNTWAGKLAGRVGKIEDWRVGHDKWAGALSGRVDKHQNWIDNHNTWAGGQVKRVDALESWKKGHDEWAGGQKKRIDGLENWKVEQNTKVDGLLGWKKAHDGFAEKLVARMDTHDEWAGKQAKKLTELEKRVGDLSVDFSDAAIIASINFQGKANTDLWNADNYDGGSVGEKDGKAVRLFKVQFQGLKSHISAMLKTYFGKEGIYTEIMQKPLNRITDLLELIKDKEIKVDVPDLKDNFTRLMTALNTLINLFKGNKDELVGIGFKDVLKQIIELLEAIRDKKMTVEIPPIEIPEIKNMPDINLSKKGNGWLRELIKTVGGIIETAIKTMGEVLGKAIDGVSENLGKLIDLVGGLLDDLVKLIVPENLDFMNKRFDGFQKKIKVKFDFLFSGIDGFKGLFSNQKKIEDIDFTLGVFGNSESVKIPLSWINKFAPYVRPVITSFVALEFLIDMYKWFHTRGEVVE